MLNYYELFIGSLWGRIYMPGKLEGGTGSIRSENFSSFELLMIKIKHRQPFLPHYSLLSFVKGALGLL